MVFLPVLLPPTQQGFDFSDFFDTKTMKSGPKGSAASQEEKDKPGRVHGFGLFQKGDNKRAPGFDPPAVVKKFVDETKEKQQQKLDEMKQAKRNLS